MKPYTLEQITELMTNHQPIDMNRVNMEKLNPIASKYLQDLEKGENKARDNYLKMLLSENCDPVKALAWLQLYDFVKNSKEGVKYNFIQFENKLKGYNQQLEEEKKNKA